ncbi:Spherulation-specific family 4-domain-containing protein [Mycena galopus ATCC 62051]|nr:Spherulation-specific family 4-domain-containing protein [Mycena galopus ATCC 62051]
MTPRDVFVCSKKYHNPTSSPTALRILEARAHRDRHPFAALHLPLRRIQRRRGQLAARLSAISSAPAVPWLTVINPDSGPGGTGLPGNDDTNYISGVSQLNAKANVRTIGYVHTVQSTAPMSVLQNNITTWKNWATSTSNISVDGIFFDEASADFTYLDEAITFARQAFGSKAITTICNFGVATAAEFYSICDVVIAFESCLNTDICADASAPPYKSQTTISANIPSGFQAQAAILVHDFAGTAFDGSTANAALLEEYVDTLVSDGVGWSYFTTSSDYSSVTTAPATAAALAADIASA